MSAQGMRRIWPLRLCVDVLSLTTIVDALVVPDSFGRENLGSRARLRTDALMHPRSEGGKSTPVVNGCGSQLPDPRPNCRHAWKVVVLREGRGLF